MKKLHRLGAVLLAAGLLVSCTPKSPVNTTAGSGSTTDAPRQTDAPIGAITPGAAHEHLIEENGSYTLYSPDGTLAIRITTDGQMHYSVSRIRDGESTQWIRPSQLGISMGVNTFYKDVTVVSASVEEVKVNYPLYGNQRNVEGHCMEAVLTLNSGSYQGDNAYTLELRAYNDGVAFRYHLPSAASRSTLSELTTYSLRSDVEKCWYGVNNQDYESEIAAYNPNLASRDIITAPLTAELKENRGYISIMEGALNESYPGVNLQAEGKATYSTCFYTTPTFQSGALTSGWRIINIADTLNDLVNNTNVYTVNEAAGELYADTDWIQAGRSAWSWCTTHSAPTYEQMREYIIAAASLGYEYNIIDDGWPGWENYKECLTDLGLLGEDLNVKQLLWGAITAGTGGYNRIPDTASVNAYLKLLQDTHMYGAKVDFWWSDANTNTTALQKYILEEAAKLQYIIDFHGCNKNTGLNITYPNELSREGVRGLENIGASNTTNYTTYAKWLNMQLYTRFLCGHADWTPATYTAMEIASLICIDSPLMVIAADPADILASPAVEFIKSIPTVWDQTVVLSDSEIGTYSVYAKENRGTWFVGGIASSTRKDATVKLSEFLPEGTYTAELWLDTSTGMEKQTLTVTASDEISIGTLAAGKGFAIRLSKLSLNQYGGEIGTITYTAPAGAVVKYTVDGSDPMTSSTAIVADGTITLTDSCRLQVAITEGDGKGTLLSYQFNKIGIEHTFTPALEYDDNQTLVTLDTGDASAKIYYTLDGSAPTVDSALLTDTVLTVTDACTLRYLVVIGDLSFEGSTAIKVRKTLSVPVSDKALTDEKALSASIGWGSAHYDTSMAPDNGMAASKISLGGTSPDTGTLFDRGISANAVSTFRYAVPEGYTRFVGVVGIDDCVYSNAGDRAKASGKLTLTFDSKVVYTSEVFRMGEYVYFDVEIPEGASTLTIRFDDAGDGVTCDNISLAAPGWVK